MQEIISLLRDQPIGRNGNAFRNGFTRVLEQDIAKLRFRVENLHDAISGGLVGGVKDCNSLSGGEYHRPNVAILPAMAKGDL